MGRPDAANSKRQSNQGCVARVVDPDPFVRSHRSAVAAHAGHRFFDPTHTACSIAYYGLDRDRQTTLRATASSLPTSTFPLLIRPLILLLCRNPPSALSFSLSFCLSLSLLCSLSHFPTLAQL